MAASPADASRRRREKRRQLDARRSKCRIRLGGHMEQWCLLKEQLGFSLHSQLAKFLLDRSPLTVAFTALGPEPVAPKGLQYLVLLSHAHSRECSLVPGLRGPGGQDGGLVWECSAGHTFSWGPSSGPKSPEEPNLTPLPSTDERSWCPEAKSGQEPAGLESNCDERAQEARMPSDASPWTYSSSPDEQPDVPKPPPSPVTHALKDGEIAPAPAAVPAPLTSPSSSASSLGSGAPRPVEVRIQPELRGTPQADQQTEPLASPGSQAQSALASAWDEDTAQIGPKRIRKAAKRELLPCDFPGCGRIFSNRQYLNHHKKYQHIHQKSFSCPEPACGKSFNFKKHLKEHVKLHSGYTEQWLGRRLQDALKRMAISAAAGGVGEMCEICGFTCRQKASLNWHRRKHAETVAALRFPCEFCGKRFEKPDSVAAHRSKSHPALLLAPQELSGPVESCSSILASASLGASEGSRSTLAPQAPILLP
ncbi:hypothetical protein E5288_WYG005567 [Bos mutus]|uniref:Zinc finger protein 692 n=1 Tax=Bos mutus TaxID=72004 RepID=A0A6B0RMQ9_9CETA|nr:hypothetical protein [Bos mutus]